MTPRANGSNRTARQPVMTPYGHAAVLLASARALEAASHEAPSDGALGPTLACLEQALDAITQVTLHLTGQVLERLRLASTASARPEREADALRRLHDMRALLDDSVEACSVGRAAAGPFLPEPRRR